MLLQISSGQGPEECELAVAKLANALCREFADTVIKQTYPGLRAGCYRSSVLESGQDLSFLDGLIKWVCKSSFRLQHKRKNWFVDVSPIKSVGEAELDSEQIVFETFRSSGKGGQHVNKTESGVRATYVPLGLSAISTDERSQHLNKKVATERLQKLVEEHYAEGKRTVERGNWLEHTRLVRGNAIRVYEGMEFRRVE
jgi:peptide chain release factor